MWPWRWNHYWEDVSLSSQDLGIPSVTQTARDSRGQPEMVRDVRDSQGQPETARDSQGQPEMVRDSQRQSEPRQAMGKDRDKKIINFGRAHQVSLQSCRLAGCR